MFRNIHETALLCGEYQTFFTTNIGVLGRNNALLGSGKNNDFTPGLSSRTECYFSSRRDDKPKNWNRRRRGPITAVTMTIYVPCISHAVRVRRLNVTARHRSRVSQVLYYTTVVRSPRAFVSHVGSRQCVTRENFVSRKTMWDEKIKSGVDNVVSWLPTTNAWAVRKSRFEIETRFKSNISCRRD